MAIDEAEEEGGVIGAVNAVRRSGWLRGYNGRFFTLRVRNSDGEVDRVGITPCKEKWFHVVGVCDGQRAELYVNGKLDAEATVAGDKIEYDEATRYVLGLMGPVRWRVAPRSPVGSECMRPRRASRMGGTRLRAHEGSSQRPA